MRPYEGLLTAMITPFHADGSVNEDAAVAIARHLLANGSHGLVIAGTTGEAATLTDDEQVRLVELIVGEAGSEGSIVAGAGSNDTRHAIELTERVIAAGAQAVLSVTPYYNKPNRRGHPAPLRRGRARRRRERRWCSTTSPAAPPSTWRPTCSRSSPRSTASSASSRRTRPSCSRSTGSRSWPATTTSTAPASTWAAPGGICVASHVVGPEMRRMYDEPDARAEIDASLHDVYETLFITASPTPVKAAMNLLGHDAGTLRLPMVEADETETAAVRAMLERHGLLSPVPAG